MFTYKKIVFLLLISVAYTQSPSQLKDFKREYERLKLENSPGNIESEEQDQNQIQNPDFKINAPIFENKSVPDSISKFFGYKFFHYKEDFEYWDSLPISSNYILGSGDEIILSLWGETQLRKKYIISREGKIYDEKAGLLNLSGRTLGEAEEYLFKRFSKVFSTLKSQNPSSFLDVSLGQIKSININLVGEVNAPGIYPLHPFSNIITALVQTGGPDTTGSLRSIKIIRNGKDFQTFDLYKYLLTGNLPKNAQLRDQDVLVVPVRLSTIVIDSAVTRPGVFELKPNETLEDLINYAGGFSLNASSTINVRAFNDKLLNSSQRSGYYNLNKAYSFKPEDGDSIVVIPSIKEINKVELIGQIKRPGTYTFSKDMNVKNLIDLGGGFDDTTFIKSVYLERAEIVRRNHRSRYESVIEINLLKAINNNQSHNIKLQNLDKLVIHSNLNYFEKENVLILGEVNIPGSYPVIKDNESMESLINRAGGFTSKSFPQGIEIYRDSIRVAWQNMRIPIFPGDSIVIKQKPGVVMIEGEVYNEGMVEFQKGKSVSYYINAAGGIKENGDRSNITVMHANGFVVPRKRFRPVRVYDGSKIIVNRKNEKPPIDFISIANVASSALTIMVLLNQLSSTSN